MVVAGDPGCFPETKPSIVSFFQLLKEFLQSNIIFQLKFTFLLLSLRKANPGKGVWPWASLSLKVGVQFTLCKCYTWVCAYEMAAHLTRCLPDLLKTRIALFIFTSQ